MPQFLFVTCQIGAEKAVKGEVARRRPEFRAAFARPGFLTFKLPEGVGLPGDFELESVFARAWGFSLGKASGSDPQGLAQAAWALAGASDERPYARIHAWERDRFEPGAHRFEPSLTAPAVEAVEALRRACPRPEILARGDHLAQPARPGDWVLDCILIDPGQWWVGWHRARSLPSRWPGGLMCIELPPEAVSRAWLKMEEALRWSQLPIPKGARCVELGSAPGGASQALLAHGLEVLGVDPAEMDPAVLAHRRFRHIRCRAAGVPRREFRKARWLTADMNVAPGYTLDVVESIVTHAEVNIRGLLLTLKLPEWALAERAAEYLARVRSWGYNVVRGRQLQYNRREFCVAALQTPFRRKPNASATRRVPMGRGGLRQTRIHQQGGDD
jgi:23S rRNA (cytidine2498-2'-O)-methyltransferase